jgi:nicotinic acid mononucleotide adenylyltransferase
LLEEVGIAVLRRSGANMLPPEMAIAAVRERLGPQTAEHVQQALLDTPLIDISSTLIRQRLREGLPIDFLVPAAVGAFLEEHRLYR